MRILDEQDNEITTDDIDGEKGYLEVEKLFVRHHPQILGQDEISHYKVSTFKFMDGSTLHIEYEDDPRVKVIDAAHGIFDYEPPFGEPDKEIQSVDVELVVEQEYQPTVEEWDEYEYIQRYKLFTDSELAANADRAAQEAIIEKFLETGPRRLLELEEKVKQLEEQLGKQVN